MSWMGTGYKSQEEIKEETPQESDNKGPKRFWVKQGGEPQRIMFLDTQPMTCWEHNYKWDGHWRNHEPCHFRMKIGPDWEAGCPMCNYKKARGDKATVSWPRYGGFYTIMQLTPWFSKRNAEINYRRQLLVALNGSDENPGVLRDLRRLSEKYGRLKGLIFDVTRKREKDESCGSDFELVEKISEDEIEAYGKKLVMEYIARENKKRPSDKQLEIEKFLKWNPWETYGDIGSIYKPKTRGQLLKMFDVSKANDNDDDGGGGYDRGGRDEGEDAFGDDDIPY